ncbi:MAG TPA: hypothetical protein VNE62_05465 [Actinomycetota bacterium]|nr:hypothetical protein [Actinomycetota bacterium]
MAEKITVYLEVGKKRVFAGALDWAGWCRSAKDEEGALQALLEYGPRYKSAVGPSARTLRLPKKVSGLDIVQRVTGDATTDFGAPSVPPSADSRSLDTRDVTRLQGQLRAAWAAFDRTAAQAKGALLRKGPRGGGREVDAIVSHVFEADRVYLSKLGGSLKKKDLESAVDQTKVLREMILQVFSGRALGNTVDKPAAKAATLWTPRYFARRCAWHALDHAWEIEDRRES